MIRRVVILAGVLLALGVLLCTAASSGLSLLTVATLLIIAADQLQTVVNFRTVSERMTLMFSAIMVVTLYLPPGQALTAALVGIGAANVIHWLIERADPWSRVMYRTAVLWLSSGALIGTYAILHHVIVGEWPSMASALSLAVAGVAYEAVSTVLLGSLKQWTKTALYPVASILIACTFGLIIEHHPMALVGAALLLLGVLKPAFNFGTVERSAS